MAPKSKTELSSSLNDDSTAAAEPQIEWIPEEPAQMRVDPVQTKIVWRNVVFFGALHLASVYALFLVPNAKPLTWLFSKFYSVLNPDFILSLFGHFSMKTVGINEVLYSSDIGCEKLPVFFSV